ncbi:MAG: endonuclease domain-containing protein [Betaproteobacteria bacterium]
MTGDVTTSPPPLRGRSDREAVREGGHYDANHRPVSAIRRARARSLRRDMTEAEKRLWYWLRAHRFRGVAFRRQTPIGQYIVDFVSDECRLVIEIDGGRHNENKADALRDQWLYSKGYRVLRFWNSEILKNRDGVLERISDAICRARPPSRRSRALSVIGDLPLKGEGEESPANGGGGTIHGAGR